MKWNSWSRGRHLIWWLFCIFCPSNMILLYRVRCTIVPFWDNNISWIPEGWVVIHFNVNIKLWCFSRLKLLLTASPLSHHEHLFGHCPWSWCHNHVQWSHNKWFLRSNEIACWLSRTLDCNCPGVSKKTLLNWTICLFIFYQRDTISGACPYSPLWRIRGPRHFFIMLIW